MPTIAMLRIPPTRSWEEFQDIVISALKSRWASPTLAQHGRQGQAQRGVDIFGPDHLGRATGVQCKCQETLDNRTVAIEIQKAEDFQPPLANFFFALAGHRDARIQQHLRILSESRLREAKFAVGIFFWEDLLEDLTSNPTEFKKHFPQLNLAEAPAVDLYAQLFCAYDVGYYGLDIRNSIDLIFGEVGAMVEENPLQLDHMMRLIEASSQSLLSSAQHSSIVKLSRQVVTTALQAHQGRADWAAVDGLAGSIESIIRALEYTLNGLPLVALDLGFAMRQWERVNDEQGKSLDTTQSERILMRTRTLGLEVRVMNILEENMAEFNGSTDFESTMIPRNAYNIVRQAIRALRFAQISNKR